MGPKLAKTSRGMPKCWQHSNFPYSVYNDVKMDVLIPDASATNFKLSDETRNIKWSATTSKVYRCNAIHVQHDVKLHLNQKNHFAL